MNSRWRKREKTRYCQVCGVYRTENKTIERLKEIIKIAYELKWITPTQKGKSYPEMQLSEVEKCMLAMVDDSDFETMKSWYKDEIQKNTH